ncbi:MAG TPA: hypothetical protein VF264_01555 [Rhodanobacteraceae bacterium]
MSRPFDAKRYKRLLEGLDVTALTLRDVRRGNDKLRIDSGYFAKLAVETQKRVESMLHVELGVLCATFRKGIFDIKADSYVDSGVPFVRISNLRDGLIDNADLVYITEATHQKEHATALRSGDVVLSKTAYPAASFVNLPVCNVSQDTIAVRLSPSGKRRCNSGYLATYLNCRFGLSLMRRQFQGNVQEHLSLPDGRKIPIPLLGDSLQTRIDRCVREADIGLQKANEHLLQADVILAASIGLSAWQPPRPLSYTRRASQIFAAGRLDAEHYQEQYFALARQLQGYVGGCVSLGELCPNPVNGVEIREYQDEGVPYLRVGDLRNFTVSPDQVKRVAPDAAAREMSKVRLQSGDVLVSRSGSLAVTGVVEPGWQHALISSHLIRVRIADEAFDPYYVAVFLAVLPGRMQIEQQSNGGVQPEINQPALKRVLIPRLDGRVQADIRAAVANAHAARDRAHQLLAAAQRAVEIAIEQDEAAALSYLDGFDTAP